MGDGLGGGLFEGFGNAPEPGVLWQVGELEMGIFLQLREGEGGVHGIRREGFSEAGDIGDGGVMGGSVLGEEGEDGGAKGEAGLAGEKIQGIESDPRVVGNVRRCREGVGHEKPVYVVFNIMPAGMIG